MKKRITILIGCTVLALLLIAALANASPSSTANASTTPGTMSGGHYQLSTTSSPMTTQATGGGYRLMSSAPNVDPAAGCCCRTNLPCLVK